jgi:TRAP-type C4-dicarboxylate transport system substrate-binding protein
MNSIKSKLIAPVVILGSLLLATPVTTVAATLDMSIFHSERSAWTHALKFWMEETKKQTQGRVEFKPFYSGALGKITETFKAVRNGSVPIGTTAAGVESSRIPSLAYIEGEAGMPNDGASWLTAAGQLRPVLDRLFDAKGVKFLWMQPSFGGTVNCRKKLLKNPSDWQNLRVRTAGRWQVEQIRKLGANPVATDPAEQYIALQNGTLDCVLSNHEITYAFKLYEVAPKVVNLGVGVNALMYIVNKKVWGKISAADQKTIERLAVEAQIVAATHLEPLQPMLRDKIRKAGVEVYSLNKAEKDAFVNAIRPVFDKMDGVSGADGQIVRKILEPHW